MNMTSNLYKLVNDQGIVIAEGSSKDMQRLRKKNKNSVVWLSPSSKIGDRLGKPINKT